MSFLGYKWHIKNDSHAGDLIDLLLENRDIKEPFEKAAFLRCDLSPGLHDPFLMKDMKAAVQRIFHAIKSEEKIIVFGDYDVDGVTSAAILFKTLQLLGALVSYRLPHRVHDGYGLNTKVIDEIQQIGVKLLITADCGIANETIISRAKEKAIDTIVTDHHSIPLKFPHSAFAVIHPGQTGCPYPYKELTGAGVAFKLAQALIIEAGLPAEHFVKLLDLACLGTIADIAPLTGENRLIVKYGLEQINVPHREAISYLKKIAWKNPTRKLNCQDVAFHLAPRLNAPGRMDSAYFALQLLISEGARAKELAAHLDRLNIERRDNTSRAIEHAEKIIENQLQAESLLIAYHPDWHSGIVGLIAGKIRERYNKPAIIMQDRGEYLVASARSPKQFSMIEALKVHDELLEEYGGHTQAAGFSIKKNHLPEFTEKIQNYARQKLESIDLTPAIEIDCEIDENLISLETIEKISQLEPFGKGNEIPTFLYKNVVIRDLKKIGAESRHINFICQKNIKSLRAIGFHMGHIAGEIENPGTFDLAVQLQKNHWNGNSSVELTIVDARKAAA